MRPCPPAADLAFSPINCDWVFILPGLCSGREPKHGAAKACRSGKVDVPDALEINAVRFARS